MDDQDRAIRLAGRAIREAKACVLADKKEAALERIEEAKLALLADPDFLDRLEHSQR